MPDSVTPPTDLQVILGLAENMQRVARKVDDLERECSWLRSVVKAYDKVLPGLRFVNEVDHYTSHIGRKAKHNIPPIHEAVRYSDQRYVRNLETALHGESR